MKTLKSILAIFILSASFLSCDPEEEPTPVVEEPAIFLYAEGGESLRSVTNPFANAGSKTIFGNNGTTNVIEIKLSSLAVGTYSISTANAFKYVRIGTASPWTAISGSIRILENTGTYISGSFELTAGDSNLGINTVAGSFKRVVINP